MIKFLSPNKESSRMLFIVPEIQWNNQIYQYNFFRRPRVVTLLLRLGVLTNNGNQPKVKNTVNNIIKKCMWNIHERTMNSYWEK